MKPRLWKSTGGIKNGMELQYRCDDGELCWEYEDDLVSLAEHYVVPYGRDGIAKLYEASVGGRIVEFMVLPAGTMPLLESDLEPHVLEGFLIRPDGFTQSRLH